MEELLPKLLLWVLGAFVTVVNAWFLFILRGLKAEDKLLHEGDKLLHERIDATRGMHIELTKHLEADFAKRDDMKALEERMANDIKEIKQMLRTLTEKLSSG